VITEWLVEDPFWLQSAFWYGLSGTLITLVALALAGHAVITKREPRSAAMWLALLLLVPVLGVLLYLTLGINRIRRKARALHIPDMNGDRRLARVSGAVLRQMLGQKRAHLANLARVIDQVDRRPLLSGNRVELLQDGDETYPAMLEAINSARGSITLCTYIFGNDIVGRDFINALAAAVERGVQVRVLIDAAGERYSWPSAVPRLRRAGVTVARFLPGRPTRLTGINLRNHRKLLVVDGRVGFTGGLNIRTHHLLSGNPPRPARDLHFRVQGPVVAELQQVFTEDWAFATGEELTGEPWFTLDTSEEGTVLARGLSDGPDADLDKFQWVLLAAINTARESISIMTPYFLPDRTLVSALNLAALRGVRVDIVLPRRNNLPYVHWAMMAQLWQMLGWGCRVWMTPPPFNHGKLFVVDRSWSFVGSTNWDPRSLRLNFEFNVECYDFALAEQLEALCQAEISRARQVTPEMLNARALPIKLRDGLARLFTPFL